MSVFDELAALICDGLVNVHRFSAAMVKATPFIDIIKQILAALLPALLACLPALATPADVAERLKTFGWYENIFVHRESRRQLGLIGAIKMGDQIAAEIKKAAQGASQEQIQRGMAEIQSA